MQDDSIWLSSSVISQIGSLWHKANISTITDFSLINRHRWLTISSTVSFQTMTAGDVVCTRVYEREWENVFEGSQWQSQWLHFICSTNTLCFLYSCFLLSPLCRCCSERENVKLPCSLCWSSCHWPALSTLSDRPTLYIRPSNPFQKSPPKEKSPLKSLINIEIKAKAVNVFCFFKSCLLFLHLPWPCRQSVYHFTQLAALILSHFPPTSSKCVTLHLVLGLHFICHPSLKTATWSQFNHNPCCQRFFLSSL